MAREPMRHVIVLLPGITGSVLQKNGTDVWAASGSAIWSGLMSSFQSLTQLRLAGDSPDEDLGDGITATRLMPDIHLIPGLWKIDGYGVVRQWLLDTFALTEGQNYFEFPYDWRRDNRVAARRLDRLSRDWLQRWRAASGAPDAKLVLVGHSMGGLVARYFLEALDGWRETRALVTFGTPYRGSLGALNSLANGERKGPFGLLDLSDVIRTFPAVYQLLPIYPAYDPGDGHLVRVGETSGIPNVDAGLAAQALAFHHEIRDRVAAHQDDDEYRTRGYQIFPVVGIEQPTWQSARLAGAAVALDTTYDGQDMRGDGTVPRVSATPLELDVSPRDMYAATHHGALQNAAAVLTHLKGVLTGLDLDLGPFRRRAPAPKARLSVQLDDAYETDQPITVGVQPTDPGLTAKVRIEAAGSRRAVAQATLPLPDVARHEATLPPLKAGVYRVLVTAGVRAEPVADVFAVFDRTIP